jgi:hypothetical protein
MLQRTLKTIIVLFVLVVACTPQSVTTSSPIETQPASPLQATSSLPAQSGTIMMTTMIAEATAYTKAHAPTPLPPTSTFMPKTVVPSATPTPFQELPIAPLTGWKIYKNDSFGLSFQFPSAWYGPDVYSSSQVVRIEVGSDKVYPYGTSLEERIYDIKNSYYIVIQYSKTTNNNLTLGQYASESQPWIKTYLSLLSLKDGESISGLRDLVIRVRKLKIGRFEGLEYIETLSATAQTEITYTRRVVLFDEHLNTLNITGTPNNVEITNKDNWRDAYRKVDEANRNIFYKVLESIAVE